MSAFSNLKYRPDLQGLRALAGGLVVCNHLGFDGLKGGYLGVDVFFVLSGFLITQLLAKELEEAGSIHLCRFYSRRVRRLFPAMLVMVLRQAAAGFQNVYVIDVIDFVCPNGTCRAMNEEGLMIYRDQFHLADGSVRSIASVLVSRMNEYLVTE